MAFLAADELRDIRRDFADSLPDTATVTRGVIEQDAAGDSVSKLLNVGTCRCEVTPFAGEQVTERGERRAGEALYTVLLPWGADVRSSNVLTIGGARYEVQNVDGRSEAFCVAATCWSRS